MDYQQLKYFLQVCEDKSFVNAADNLFITQQALRKSIKKLESELGISLLYRKDMQILPTPAGESVRAHAITIEFEMDKMRASVEAYRDGPGHIEVRVVMANGCFDRIAAKVLAPFSERHPNVDLQIIERPDLICEQYVLGGVVPFGFTFGPVDGSMFEIDRMATYNVVAMMSKDHPLADRKSLAIIDLKGESIGIADQWYRIFYNFEQACRTAGFEPRIGFKGGDPYSVHSFGRMGRGVIITAVHYEREFDSPDLVAIPIRLEDITDNLCMITRKGMTLSKLEREFVEMCRAQITC